MEHHAPAAVSKSWPNMSTFCAEGGQRARSAFEKVPHRRPGYYLEVNWGSGCATIGFPQIPPGSRPGTHQPTSVEQRQSEVVPIDSATARPTVDRWAGAGFIPSDVARVCENVWLCLSVRAPTFRRVTGVLATATAGAPPVGAPSTVAGFVLATAEPGGAAECTFQTYRSATWPQERSPVSEWTTNADSRIGRGGADQQGCAADPAANPPHHESATTPRSLSGPAAGPGWLLNHRPSHGNKPARGTVMIVGA